MMKFRWRWFGFFVMGAIFGAITQTHIADAATPIDLVKAKVAERFTGARVEATSSIVWQNGVAPDAPIESVQILGETSSGTVQFSATTQPDASGVRSVTTGTVRFAAFVPAKIATKRVLPGERLQTENFKDQDVDVANGMGREYRGVMVSTGQDLAQLESRQTILEGQFLVSSAIRRIHDVRKGDAVRIELYGDSGLRVSLTGTAEEPGYLNDSVRVIANRTKRALVGKLRADNLVEVKL